ncbi:HNH endonuclease [Peribacillus sp. SCS-155]|uniref:HNH endonuclease n=1 Tax=Peribacillus sedimenti TaxID=3115297 RepID=UPI003906C2C3
MITEAINYVLNEVHNPALNHPTLDKSIKNKVQRSKTVISKMKKIGDIYNYLSKFSNVPAKGERLVYDELKKLGLKTYEDLYVEFQHEFNNYLDEVTTLSDFTIGKQYSSWDIAIFSKTYDVQSGIYKIPGNPELKAIFIKATLENGKYKNEWLVQNEVLKYYFYSLKNKFSTEYEVNKAILSSKVKNIPIYVFIKEGTICTLSGIFEFVTYTIEPDNSMWFTLKKVDIYKVDNPVNEIEYERDFTEKVVKSLSDVAGRKQRLKIAPKTPGIIKVVTTNFKRNPDVVAEVLDRADGVCEFCGNDAPFVRASNGTPYLEVHHVIPLALGGEDTIENAMALCPNCHREAHFGDNRQLSKPRKI